MIVRQNRQQEARPVAPHLSLRSGQARETRVLKPGGFFQFSVIHPCADTRHFRWVRDESGAKVGYLVGDYFGLGPERGEPVVEEWYFGTAPEEVKEKARKFRVPHFFRTLADYVNALIDAGLVVERLAEPFASEEAARKCPYVADSRLAPLNLILRCRKP